ncbi:hypothetical protein G5V59_18785 [Nocardioides sp. W3-2-3]|uniref:hypothetical protein n=1 Tax=Nocardioides convexus TaxID=2712224 RepID=UPI002418AE03|nr:hypothetical protein [Nocardioides convexus]NHA01208.1 hypothetical protein [Nocardioides convexus]
MWETRLGLDDNSELLDQARQKWTAWVAADPRLGVVETFDDLRAWLPSVDSAASDEVLLALAMLAAPDGGDNIAAAAALAKCLLPGACRLAGWLSTLPPREVFRDSQPVASGSRSAVERIDESRGLPGCGSRSGPSSGVDCARSPPTS